MKYLATVFVAALCLTQARAAPIYDTSAPLTGTTTLDGFGNWTGNVFLNWNIVQVGSLFNYSYTFSEAGSNLSHVVLEFSSSCANDQACLTNATNNPDGPRTYAANTAPNFELPTAMFGVKFDFSGSSPYTFSFTSNRAPVYGDIFARDGGNAYAYNNGITNHSSSLASDFVARPDTVGAVPEPATLALYGAGLIALGLLRRRQNKTH